MVQTVGDDGVLGAEQRLEDGAIGIEAGGKEDGILHLQIAGDALFQGAVQVGGAADEAHAGHAEAVAVHGLLGGGDDLRVVGKAQVVVGAEVQDLAASGDRDVGGLRGVDFALNLPEGLRLDGIEFGGEHGGVGHGGHLNGIRRVAHSPCRAWWR